MLGDKGHLKPPECQRKDASRTGTCPVQDMWSFLSSEFIISFAREAGTLRPYFLADPVCHMFYYITSFPFYTRGNVGIAM